MYQDYAYLIVGLPVLAFVLTIFLGWHLPKGGGFFTVLATFAGFILSFGIFREIYPNDEIVHQSMHWFASFNAGILIDPLAIVMLLMVTFVCTLIHTYALGYMDGDPGMARYFAEAGLFTAAMLGLVFSDNLLQLFIFWELVGLCSYLLIGFWYRKPSAASAAKKAFLVTRVGDVMFLAGIVLLYTNMAKLNLVLPEGTYLLQFQTIYDSLNLIPPDQLTWIAVLLFGGAVGKSGQFPLHVWLPDAMEGPTTVSAMIHAATMVTAGVYLVARMFPLFYAAPNGLTVVAYVGAFTALFAATMGLVMFDIKRVLAYSTVSQLGYMMAALGFGAAVGATAVGVSIFHLIGHSFFKALLFLCAGSVIHAVGTNDMREMGGVLKHMKWTGLTMLAGSLTLAGFPLTTGFFSKDQIIVLAFENGAFGLGWIPYVFVILAALLTAIYTFRLWFLTFDGEARSDYHKHESPWIMLGPLVILAIFALFMGMPSQEGFYHYVGNNFDHFGVDFEELAVIGGHHVSHAHVHEPFIIKILPIIIGVGGIIVAALFYSRWKRFDPGLVTSERDPLRKILLKRYYQNEIYTLWFAEKVVYGIALVSNMIDLKIIDGAVNKISAISVGFGGTVRKLQTGVIQNYLTAIVLGVAVLLIVIQLASMGVAI
ncbi:MAG: NADH-quinone oxidoreductase subunit L [Methanothrix sp.]|jgi:NADH-quinone oxidoreductase subunit L|nr:NADH-quinone oxidoreductase subunit L [Methanothrix sp.]OPX78219.1 MAG: F(420)H(2) dehydrogenase subunit L [Methanosaeta sp. PtaB.Bin087]NLX39135.1 NADH-quinone oxidoreductase subunit L [Methanothrix sp.]HNT71506.1 NADH-quinone oxidoreductase subunit L [Methanothrix sp.]HOI68134.1 NADH-quinone oxidoreductase subunit L [Methanothrix sp.]